jgi:hypothetical protein
MRTVHILAGGPATNYTLHAWHTDYPDICSTATVSTVLIELMPEHSAFRADDATRMLFSAEIVNMDISDLSWSVLPSVNGGARLHTSSSSAGGGATSVTGISNIWLLPGNVATNYTLTAYHRMVEDTYGNPTITATSRVDVIAFDINRSRTVMKSHGPATNVFSVVSSDGELPDWKIEPVNAVSGAGISATTSGSYGSEAHGTADIRINPQQVATNYTITATHPVHTNITQVAELVVADIVLEPITCETNSIGYTVNPSGVPMDGGFGTFKITVEPVALVPDSDIEWIPHDPTSVEFLNNNVHGREVGMGLYNGAVQTVDVMIKDLVHPPPEISFAGHATRTIPVRFMVTCEDDGNNPAATATQCTNWIQEANGIFDQIGVELILQSVSYTNRQEWWELDFTNKVEMAALRDSLPAGSGFEVYVINSFDNGGNISAVNSSGGTIIKKDAFASSLCHELGHQLGLYDIYESEGDMSVADDILIADWLPHDWTGDDGVSYYNPAITHHAVLKRLLMFGRRNADKCDIPLGNVRGIWYRREKQGNAWVKVYREGYAPVGRFHILQKKYDHN